MDPVTGAALIGAGSQIVGGLFGASAQSKANAANLKQSREQMAWQEKMSNTAHQRQTADMKAAGLNPMLSAMQSGASTGSSQMMEQRAVNPMAGLEEAGHSAMEAMRLKKEVKLADTQAKLNTSSMHLNHDTANKMMDERDILSQKHQQEKLNTKAMQYETNARIESAKYLENQAKQDRKFQTFDNYERRVNAVISGVNNAASIINPLSKIKGFSGAGDSSAKQSRNRSYTEEKYNSQGEHMGSRSRRYHD